MKAKTIAPAMMGHFFIFQDAFAPTGSVAGAGIVGAGGM